jgi:hypothetical protein
MQEIDYVIQHKEQLQLLDEALECIRNFHNGVPLQPQMRIQGDYAEIEFALTSGHLKLKIKIDEKDENIQQKIQKNEELFAKLRAAIEQQMRTVREQMSSCQILIARDLAMFRKHEFAETDDVRVIVRGSRIISHPRTVRIEESLTHNGYTVSMTPDHSRQIAKNYDAHELIIDIEELNKALIDQWVLEANAWLRERLDRYNTLLLERKSSLRIMKDGVAWGGDNSVYEEEKAKYEEASKQLKALRAEIGQQMGIDQSVGRYKVWSNVMAKMTELEYNSLVELRSDGHFSRNIDNGDQRFRQYSDDIDRIILNRYHTLSVLKPNADRLLPQGLEDVRLKGTSLSRTAFQKALRVGDYGIHQAWRVVRRIAALNLGDAPEDAQTNAKAVAQAIYSAGWYKEGQTQVFNYLRSVGAIDDTTFRAGIELIANNGRIPQPNALGDAQAAAQQQEQEPAIKIPEHYGYQAPKAEVVAQPADVL